MTAVLLWLACSYAAWLTVTYPLAMAGVRRLKRRRP